MKLPMDMHKHNIDKNIHTLTSTHTGALYSIQPGNGSDLFYSSWDQHGAHCCIAHCNLYTL